MPGGTESRTHMAGKDYSAGPTLPPKTDAPSLRRIRAMLRPTLIIAFLVFTLQSAHAAEPIRLGLNYPSTGNYKSEGLELRRGALLAVDQINQGGGLLGRRLELVSLNSAARAEKARANVDRFANQGAAMIFGGANLSCYCRSKIFTFTLMNKRSKAKIASKDGKVPRATNAADEP